MENTTQIPGDKPAPPFPQQKQAPPGLESKIEPRPEYSAPFYKAAGKLIGKRALVTGGDSGIGRAVAVLFAREGAEVAITFLPEERGDADETAEAILQEGHRCVLLEGDLTNENFCHYAVEETVRQLGGLDILVSNAAYQQRKESLEDLTSNEWDRTFKTNIYAYFHLVKAAVPFLRSGASIIATSSETAFLGPRELPDYSATKGAINTFTRSLAQMLSGKGIRVNAVAPGPVWTPLNIADQGESAEKVAQFGSKPPANRPAQPDEIAPLYVFLASEADSSYISGAIIPETGGKPIQ